jgi:predicted amino acid-binding ACT domain protein
MKAALMWTINDFPAYGMLSGWMTAGKLACPYCMEHTKAFRLYNGGKTSWFDCHRQFLPNDHVFRRSKDAFFKDRVERSEPPPRLTGEQIWHKVQMKPMIINNDNIRISGYGVDHNWTKRSIFWELPYWSTNLIRHNLDVMHIEKNVFDNVFNTVMDIKGKTKDNVNARRDLKLYCNRKDLEVHEQSNGKIIKPKANYTFTLEQKRAICEWVKCLKMPDGYASNLARCVDMKEGKLHGMKSHDCHVFMECLLPIAFVALPEHIWKPLTEISQFFRDLCSTSIRVDDIINLEENIPIVLCKLEKKFPSWFF